LRKGVLTVTVPASFIPKYRRHKGSGQALIEFRGQRRYLGVYGSPESKEAYSRFVAELAASPLAASAVPSPAPSLRHLSVVELADAYWQFCQGYYRKKDGTPSGWLRHIHLTLHQHLCGLYGRIPAAEFGPKAFKAIRQRLVDAGNSRPYINKLMPIIVRAFKWGAAEELVSPAVYHALRTVEGLRKGRTAAPEPPPILPVDEAAVDATLPTLPQVVADMVRFQRLTGCRPGEVCQLRPIDLDRSREVWEFRPASHKTEHHGRERIIFIGPKAQAVILPYLLRGARAHCFSPAESEAKRRAEMRERRKSKVQPSQRDRRKARPRRCPAACYNKDSYTRAVNRGIKKANQAILEKAGKEGIKNPALVPTWHPNQLRHTRGTEIRRKFGLEATQVVLGHSKADVTQVYAERNNALAVEVMRKIG
jgi:integrase